MSMKAAREKSTQKPPLWAGSHAHTSHQNDSKANLASVFWNNSTKNIRVLASAFQFFLAKLIDPVQFCQKKVNEIAKNCTNH